VNRVLLAALAAFIVSVVLVLDGPVEAQFETPNRSFHDATAFRLEGRHLTVACTSCHLNEQYAGTPTTCYACHWVRRKDDRYQTRLGAQCEQCHRPVAWSAVNWNHSGMTGVALNASHRTISCVSCHRDGQFTPGAVLCASCHRKDFDATRSPNHAAAGFPLVCEGCHRPGDSTWRTSGGAGFNHNAFFPLQGVHATVSCDSCHRSGVFRGTTRACVGCHQTAYNATQNPNHAAAGFPTTCENCHRATDSGWRTSGGAGFNHNAFFPLQGVHATISCDSCHRNSVFRGTTRTCVGCHQAAYNATRNPNHAAAGFPTSCESCHRATDSTFTQGRFSHPAFPLSGPHNRRCNECHTTPNAFSQFSCTTCHSRSDMDHEHRDRDARGYQYQSRACYSCHPDGRKP
jgi:hypothetical protein